MLLCYPAWRRSRIVQPGFEFQHKLFSFFKYGAVTKWNWRSDPGFGTRPKNVF